MKIYRTAHNKILLRSSVSNGTEEQAVMSEPLFNELKAELFGNMFDTLCELQKLAWANDDLMTQDTLFDLQDKLATLSLSVASKISPLKVDSLVKQFPWLYEVKGE